MWYETDRTNSPERGQAKRLCRFFMLTLLERRSLYDSRVSLNHANRDIKIQRVLSFSIPLSMSFRHLLLVLEPFLAFLLMIRTTCINIPHGDQPVVEGTALHKSTYKIF